MSRTSNQKWFSQRKFFKKWWRTIWVVGVLLFLILLLLFSIVSYFQKRAAVPAVLFPDAPYRHAEYPIEQRVEDLLSRMTLEEKVGQMALVEKKSILDIHDIASYGIGALLSGGGGNPENNSIVGWREMVASFMDASRTSRLNIPILYGVDAVHGHSNVLGATVFPHFIGLGATRDTDLVEKIARATAQELVATGVYWSFSPTLDMPQDIRWGRVYEAFSDDPKLVQSLGTAYVRGLQNEEGKSASSSDAIFVLSTLKHYIGAGSMVWGSSSGKEYFIDQGTTPPSETLLRGVYLPPFADAINVGAQSVMVGLNSWGTTKLSAKKYLISDVLKDELGFTGFVVSDWYGVYEIPEGKYQAAVTAITAGVDMLMLPYDYKAFVRNVVRAVDLGDIPEERINDAVRRILRAKFSLGLFDAPRTLPVANGSIGSVLHRALARDAVAKSLVLLKNEGAVLPITKNIQHIRVAGSAADNVGRQAGAWTVEWQGIDGNWLPESTSILGGIRARAGTETLVEYEISGNFATGTELADLGIAIVGEKPYAEGVGDRANPTLDSDDLATIARLKKVSKKVAVVIISGRPLIISDKIRSWDALVAAWLPGSEGVGVADVLFGDVPFSGKLPLPWPDHIGQLPITSDGHTADGTAPLFPRYFGLE